MIFYDPAWILAFVFSYTFFAMGKHDAQDGMSKDHGLLWAALSLAISAVVLKFIDHDWKGVLFFQVLFFFGIGAFRAWLETKQK